MPKFIQIIEVDEQGVETLFHPETDADYILPGETYKVPKIADIAYWDARGKEVEEARKGKTSLKIKIDELDTALMPINLLNSIKTVDGTNSGLDADLLDGRTVDDTKDTTSEIWTAYKTKSEIDKKLFSSEVVTIATPSKILRLNSQGNLDTNITKNAATATKFMSPVVINFSGDAVGGFTLNGNENAINVDLQIQNDSHTHNKLVSNQIATTISSNGDSIVEFKSGEEIKSYIDKDGVYQGDAKSVNGLSVNNNSVGDNLWTSNKIDNTYTKAEHVRDIISEDLSKFVTFQEDIAEIGPFKIYKGIIDIGGLAQIEVPIPSEITTVFNESYIVNTRQSTIAITRTPDPTTNTIVFSRTPEVGATLSWYIMGA